MTAPTRPEPRVPAEDGGGRRLSPVPSCHVPVQEQSKDWRPPRLQRRPRPARPQGGPTRWPAAGPASDRDREQPRGRAPSLRGCCCGCREPETGDLGSAAAATLGGEKEQERRGGPSCPAAHAPGTSTASGQALYCILAVSRARGWTPAQKPCPPPLGSLRQVAQRHLRRKQWAGRLMPLVCALGDDRQPL